MPDPREIARGLNPHLANFIKAWPQDQMGEDWWFSPKDIGLQATWARILAHDGIFRTKRYQTPQTTRYLYQWTDLGREVASALREGSPE